MTTQIRDHPTASSAERLLTDAIRVLTEAARATADFAEFAASALAGAAANLGGIEALLAGRPGSWEAHHVRELLTGTVGHDEPHLHEHRTEPVVIWVHVEDLLTDLGYAELYDDAHQELDRREDAIHTGQVSSGEEKSVLDELDQLHDALDTQRRQDWAAYGGAFAANVRDAVAEMLLWLAVPVHVVVELDWRGDLGSGADRAGQEVRLWERACELTPLPGSGPLDRLHTDAGGRP